MRKFFIYSLLIVLILLFLYGESRSIYCVGNNKCVTVWKTFGNVCYIIPGKYYGMTKPSVNFLQCTNANDITLYFSEDLPNGIVYRSFEDVDVNSGNQKDVVFYDYNSDAAKFHSILYIRDAKKFKDVRPNIEYIDINVPENYALNKDGEKID